MLNKVRIVLVDTTHPGNIGSAARAMKTMGLSQLVLVRPKDFPHGSATALAAGADDLLAKAVIVESFEEAIADCHFVVGTSARDRRYQWPLMTPRECSERLLAESAKVDSNRDSVALVFGTEKSGLTNEMLQTCSAHVCIPTNEDYSSLNLAAAVQVLAYECRQAWLASLNRAEGEFENGKEPCDQPANIQDIERFYEHLERVLIAIEFLNPDNPKRLMERLRRLFARVGLEEMEVNILRGVLTAVERKLLSLPRRA